MSREETRRCNTCHWDYYPLNANDPGVCGTCARVQGLMPRTPETDFIDERVRECQKSANASRRVA